jgi:integrase
MYLILIGNQMSKNKTILIINDVEIIEYFINGNFKMKEFKKFPFASYPNGKNCIPVNSFLQSNEVSSLSYESIKKKAFNLSHLINYCFKEKINFSQFNEENLINFSNNLKNELNLKNPNKKLRSNSTINWILKTCISFFDYIGKKLLNIDDYCQTILNAVKRKVVIDLGESNKKIEKSGWHHMCFAPYDHKKKRTPITQNQINALYEAIPELSGSRYIQQRTIVMLKLLEITGARAGEISQVEVQDIENSLKQEKPLLRMVTLKTRSKDQIERFVPVEKIDLKFIQTFIKIYRGRIIRKTIGKAKDHGFLFTNEKTGNQLLPVTITNEMKRLKDIAGIEGQACAHMFRHRFITKCFVKLIKQYDLENKDDFRNALMDINSLKAHIQQLTGHTKVSSLDHYIDLAKDELTNIDAVVDKISLSNKYEAYERNENMLLRQLENNEITIREYTNEIKELRKYRKSI